MFSRYSSIQEGMNNSREEESEGNMYSYICIFQADVEEGTIFQTGDIAEAEMKRHDRVQYNEWATF